MFCPKGCKIDLPENELRQHLVSAHKLTPEKAEALIRGHGGYYERQARTPDGDTVALKHREATEKAMLKQRTSDLMDIPITVAPEPKKELRLPEGWVAVGDGVYSFERTISEKHSIDSILTKTLKGEVTINHGTLNLQTSIKDIHELTELENKARVLLSRLSGYIPRDPEHSIISGQYSETYKQTEFLRQNLIPEITVELILEEYSPAESGTDEHVAWQESFMQKVLGEVTRLVSIEKSTR